MAENNATGSSLHVHQNSHANTPSPYDIARQYDNEFAKSISAWELRAKAAWKDADTAEAQGQWDDSDYYVNLAELCEEMAWNTRIYLGTETS